jgi:hypothetical protein
MRNTIIIALFSLVMAGCTKDKFTSRPQLTYKKVNGNFIPRDAVMEMTLHFTDAEGDFPGNLYVERRSKLCPADTVFKDSTNLPEFPATKNTEGDIIVSYSNGIIAGYYPMADVPSACDDTTVCYFRFVLHDKAGNRSDTINSEEIAISKF